MAGERFPEGERNPAGEQKVKVEEIKGQSSEVVEELKRTGERAWP